jgi:hypothetical protein
VKAACVGFEKFAGGRNGRIPVGINEKSAVALADVLDEKIDEEGGFADA